MGECDIYKVSSLFHFIQTLIMNPLCSLTTIYVLLRKGTLGKVPPCAFAKHTHSVLTAFAISSLKSQKNKEHKDNFSSIFTKKVKEESIGENKSKTARVSSTDPNSVALILWHWGLNFFLSPNICFYWNQEYRYLCKLRFLIYVRIYVNDAYKVWLKYSMDTLFFRRHQTKKKKKSEKRENHRIILWGVCVRGVRGGEWNADAEMRRWKTVNCIVPYFLDDMFEPHYTCCFWKGENYPLEFQNWDFKDRTIHCLSKSFGGRFVLELYLFKYLSWGWLNTELLN